MKSKDIEQIDKAWNEVHSALKLMFDIPLPVEKIGWNLHRALVLLAPYRVVNQKDKV